MKMVKHSRNFLILLVVLMLSSPLWAKDEAESDVQANSGKVVQLEVQGPIGPATSNYFERNLDKAVDSGAQIVLIRMDTPGGLDTSMRQMIKKILGSPIPVVSYVSPSGARAASAGTYILYASHVAAMAPGTNLGAATPVQMIGPGTLDDYQGDEDKEESDQKEKKDTVVKDPMTHKAVNDAVAYIRGLAKIRGRNADWAEKAVRQAVSLPAEEALEQNVIDLIATDQADLLRKLDGRKVNVLGREITLKTTGAVIDQVEPDWRSELLAVITNPNIAYILMLIGIYGLIFEFTNPGAIVPGTIGGICLLLALYAFQLLPVNYAGMALIILGVSLMIAEAFVPSVGILGLGGVIAFVIGSVILMDTDAPGFGINPGLVGGFALASAAFFILALGMLIKSRSKSIVSGKEEMIGTTGVALEDFDETGMIRIHSENWRAQTDKVLHKSDKAIVTGLDGLTLLVTPLKNEEK